jgi:hypothetical protein
LPFPPLKRYGRPAYHRHHLYPEVFEPTFARFGSPDDVESFAEIARSTGLHVRTLYHWRDAYRVIPQWGPDHSSPGSGRTFTDS